MAPKLYLVANHLGWRKPEAYEENIQLCKFFALLAR
jgi:hypothetical protein